MHALGTLAQWMKSVFQFVGVGVVSPSAGACVTVTVRSLLWLAVARASPWAKPGCCATCCELCPLCSCCGRGCARCLHLRIVCAAGPCVCRHSAAARGRWVLAVLYDPATCGKASNPAHHRCVLLFPAAVLCSLHCMFGWTEVGRGDVLRARPACIAVDGAAHVGSVCLAARSPPRASAPHNPRVHVCVCAGRGGGWGAPQRYRGVCVTFCMLPWQIAGHPGTVKSSKLWATQSPCSPIRWRRRHGLTPPLPAPTPHPLRVRQLTFLLFASGVRVGAHPNRAAAVGPSNCP
jgi:hypothetical protein